MNNYVLKDNGNDVSLVALYFFPILACFNPWKASTDCSTARDRQELYVLRHADDERSATIRPCKGNITRINKKVAVCIMCKIIFRANDEITRKMGLKIPLAMTIPLDRLTFFVRCRGGENSVPKKSNFRENDQLPSVRTLV